ncbi:MAG: hypothetical protein IJN85_03705 [Oscillospiraceae bacterium]|nr:hypothetical protein [Oscillospiraceae bacterium]
MEDIIKITVIALVAVVLYIIVKQVRAEYAVFVEICSVAVVAVFALNYATDMLYQASSFIELSGVGTDCIKILIKSLGIAVVTQISGDVCRDNGNSALASCLEMAGKVVIVLLALPIIQSVSQLAIELINS